MTVKSGESVGTVEVTPSGIPVYYQSQPKRLYRIGQRLRTEVNPPDHEATMIALLAQAQDETRAAYWREVPSVTTVLGVLDKPALVWWGMKVGIEGTLKLFHDGHVRTTPGRYGRPIPCTVDDEGTHTLLVDDAVGLLTEHKLTVNHVRDNAGDRGQAVHDALENWARHGHMPDPSIYPEEQEGYVRGLVAFLKDIPTAEPVGAEVLVASSEHGYAGRYDLRIKTNAEHDVVVRQTATKTRRRPMAAGIYLADLKTSKDVYSSHARQLEAYEKASIESGYEPTDGRGILLVKPDGTYEFRRSWATFWDFKVVLEVWKSEQEMKVREKLSKSTKARPK